MSTGIARPSADSPPHEPNVAVEIPLRVKEHLGLDMARLAALAKSFGLSGSLNAYVRSAWFALAISNRYSSAVPPLDAYLNTVGRMLASKTGAHPTPVARRN
jgi:hypothetical protein